MINKNKELVLLINSFDGGGAERQFSILVDYLPFTSIYCLESDNVYVDEAKHPINFLSKHTNKSSSLLKYLSTPVYAFRLFRLLREKKNIRIVSVLERSHIVCYLLSFFLKFEYVLSFQLSHKAHYQGLSGAILKFLFKKVIQRSVLSIPNSFAGEAEMANLYSIPLTKIAAIPNGYNFDEINSRANQQQDCPFISLLQQNYILCVARFFGQKAQDKLIAAFSNVKINHPNIKLVFAGIGEKMLSCIALSKSLNLKTFVMGEQEYDDGFDVYFLGFQKNPLVLMKHAQIFAFPTYYEGLPNALIEAMICGAIPISSDCPTGPREIIAPNTKLDAIATDVELSENGILVTPFDSKLGHQKSVVQHWASAIAQLLDNAALAEQLRAHLPKRVESYNMNVIIKKWNDLLNKGNNC